MVSGLQSELEAFRQFVGNRVDNGNSATSLEHALKEFRAYQRDLERFMRDTRESLEQSARGESKPIDIEEVVAQGRQRLAEKGIVD